MLVEVVRTYIFALILKFAIEVLEQPDPTLEKVIIKVVPITIIIIVISIISNHTSSVMDVKSDKLYYTLNLERTMISLDKDYEQLERQDVQEVLERSGRYLYTYGGIFGVYNRGINLIQRVLAFITGCAIIMTVNVWLIFVLVLLAILKLLINNKRQKKWKKANDKRIPMQRRLNYTNNISTNLSIGKDLRIYNMDQFIDEERKKAVDELLKIERKKAAINCIYDSVYYIIGIIDSLCLYGVMIYEVINNNMEISVFSYMISAVTSVITSLSSIAIEVGYLYRNSLEADDYVLFVSDAYTRKGQTEVVSSDDFVLEFQNVYYSYYLQDGYALEDVSFKIKKGEKVALVGYNGAGKTTLTKLICGLYHPTKGKILINGVDIETISRECLADLISPVFQDTLIYSYNVEENVAMAFNDNLDSKKVSEVLESVDLKNKIDSLENKEKTLLTREFDEKGIELSGGETQKLTIARALYKNSPLCILDEPTSAMDAISEASLYENFNKIIKENAVIFISHRLSSTEFCDRIIVLDNGKIIEEGTHKQLMAKKDGLYYQMFTSQAKYYQE